MGIQLTRTLRRYLLTGLFILGPIGVSLMLLQWIISLVDGLLAPFLPRLFEHPVPGLGFLMAILILLAVGFFSSNIVGHHALELVEDLLLRIPVFNWFYRTMKQLAEAFSPESQGKFKSVVLVEYPRPQVYSLGFVTNSLQVEKVGAEEMLCIYIPTNHFYMGDIVLAPKSKVIQTGMTFQEGLQSILSAGASLPSRLPASSDSKELPS